MQGGGGGVAGGGGGGPPGGNPWIQALTQPQPKRIPNWYTNPPPSTSLPSMLGGKNLMDMVLEAPDSGRVGIYKTPSTERKFSEFIDVQEVKEPLLRPSFQEGGAEVIDEIHKDKNLQIINRLMWQSFKNYTWESNQEQDNPLYAKQLIEEAHRFASPLDGEDELEMKNLQAKMEIDNQDMAPPYRVSEEIKRDADVEGFMIDVHPGPDVPMSGKAVQSCSVMYTCRRGRRSPNPHRGNSSRRPRARKSLIRTCKTPPRLRVTTGPALVRTNLFSIVNKFPSPFFFSLVLPPPFPFFFIIPLSSDRPSDVRFRQQTRICHHGRLG